MKHVTILLVLFTALFVQAEKKIEMNFKNIDVYTLIEKYSKASNQKFIIDPSVRGKVTLFLPGEVSLEEAFNHISSALAIQGYAISTQGDTKVVRAARNTQKDFIEVGTAVPSLKPERMYSWVYQLQVASADSVLKQFRNLTSKDGDIIVYENNNQLIITDWTSSINRIAAILKEIDIKSNVKK